MVHVFHSFMCYVYMEVPVTCLLPQPLLALSTSMFSFASSPGGGSSLKHHTEKSATVQRAGGINKGGGWG